MDTVRWGIVGPGRIANKFACAIKNVEGASLTAVGARSREKGEEFAQKYGIGRVFDDLNAMAGSDEIDAVYIATPHSAHLECGEIFIKNKKHVLCEKPLCLNADQAQHLISLASAHGVFLMEAMWTALLPAVRRAIEMARGGEIGKAIALDANFCFATADKDLSRVYKNELGGGALLDVGVYTVSLAQQLFGCEPETVLASARIDREVDEYTAVTLMYPEGRVATLSSAICINVPCAAQILCERGRIFIPDFYKATEIQVFRNGEYDRIELPPAGDGFEEEIAEASLMIREGRLESDKLPLSHTLSVARLMDEVRRQVGVRFQGEK